MSETEKRVDAIVDKIKELPAKVKARHEKAKEDYAKASKSVNVNSLNERLKIVEEWLGLKEE